MEQDEQTIELEEIFGGGSSNTVETENHSLFITEEEGEKITLVLPEEYHEQVGVKEVTIPTPKYKQYTLYTSAYSSGKDIFKLIHKLRGATEEDILELHIDSPGGYVTEGVTLMNIMREIFKGRTKTVLDPSGASMGAFLFGKGDVRVCYEDSDIMYHNYSGGAIGKGGEIKVQVEASDKRLERLFRKAFVDTGYFTKNEYEDLRMGQDYYFDAYEMCLRGIATHVIVEGDPLEAEEFVAYIDSDLTYGEWVEVNKEEELDDETKQALEALASMGFDVETVEEEVEEEISQEEFYTLKEGCDVDWGEED